MKIIRRIKGIIAIIAFIFIGLGCKKHFFKEIKFPYFTKNSQENTKKNISLNTENNSSENNREACFQKLGSINGDDNEIADFRYFSIEAITKNFKTHLIIKKEGNTRSFVTDIVLDMGDFYYWAYNSKNGDRIYLLELDNYYSSVFFILLEKDQNLYNLGSLSINQPDAEEGLKKESFKFCYFEKSLNIEAYLDKQLVKTKKIIIPLDKFLQKIDHNKLNSFKTGQIVIPQVETYLNVRSAPNSRGNIVRKAYPADQLEVTEVLGGWLKIDLNGIKGYVSSAYVSHEAP